MVEIVDRESVKSWLEGKRHEVQVAFAARCALRALPAVAMAGSAALGDMALPVMRAILISGAAANGAAPEIKFAASGSSCFAADSAASAAAADAAAAALSAACAESAAASAAASAASDAAYAVAVASDAASDAAHAAASMDASNLEAEGRPRLLFNSRIWPTTTVPEGVQTAYDKLRAFWKEDLPTWGFWQRWYEGMFEGHPLDWDLQREVALIPNDDWKKGPEHIARLIAEIEARFWADLLPQHEELVRNETTGKFSVKALPFDGEAAVEGWLRQIDFAVALAVDSNRSDFNRMCTAYKYIAHTLENCRNDPNAIEQQLGTALSIIEGNLAKPDYVADDSLHALTRVLSQIQVQMRADHPEVRKAWEKRIAQKLRETDRDTKLRAAEAIRAETARTDDRLSVEMELDAETVATSDSPEAQATALRRAGGRAAKMNAMERASETVEGIEKSTGYKAVRIGTTGYTVGDIIWMLTDLFRM